MAEIRIGNLTSSIEVTDTNALLSPRVLAQIVQAVIEETERRKRDAQSRDALTRIGDGGGRR